VVNFAVLRIDLEIYSYFEKKKKRTRKKKLKKKKYTVYQYFNFTFFSVAVVDGFGIKMFNLFLFIS
jgi:hypothetical protein